MILLYCTGRVTHDRVDLYELDVVVARAGEAAMNGLRGIALSVLPDGLTPEKGGNLGMRLHLPCVACSREPVWTPARTRMIHAAAVAADMRELDLSYLD